MCIQPNREPPRPAIGRCARPPIDPHRGAFAVGKSGSWLCLRMSGPGRAVSDTGGRRRFSASPRPCELTKIPFRICISAYFAGDETRWGRVRAILAPTEGRSLAAAPRALDKVVSKRSSRDSGGGSHLPGTTHPVPSGLFQTCGEITRLATMPRGRVPSAALGVVFSLCDLGASKAASRSSVGGRAGGPCRGGEEGSSTRRICGNAHAFNKVLTSDGADAALSRRHRNVPGSRCRNTTGRRGRAHRFFPERRNCGSHAPNHPVDRKASRSGRIGRVRNGNLVPIVFRSRSRHAGQRHSHHRRGNDRCCACGCLSPVRSSVRRRACPAQDGLRRQRRSRARPCAAAWIRDHQFPTGRRW